VPFRVLFGRVKLTLTLSYLFVQRVCATNDNSGRTEIRGGPPTDHGVVLGDWRWMTGPWLEAV
jgi:hypothetical protein